MRKLWIVVAALAAAALPGVANAVVCYTLFDKGDNVLYQDSVPPVDMSERGASARDSMRQRNEYLLVYEIEHCASIAAVTGSTGYRPATVEEIVSGMRPYAPSVPGASSGRGSGVIGAPTSAPAPRSGSTGVRSGSTGMRSGY
jgi:hypothetical protein